MLTATYSLVAIATEQDKTRRMLSRLQQYLHSTWRGLQNIDLSFLETAFGKLLQFDKYFSTRKLELYLIPAMRNAGREAESLVAELDALSVKGATILRSLGDHLAQAFDMSAVRVNQICHAMESYCGTMLVRIEREERELIPLARRLFSIEDWFTIAAQFLSDDSDVDGRRGKTDSQRTMPSRGRPVVFVR